MVVVVKLRRLVTWTHVRVLTLN